MTTSGSRIRRIGLVALLAAAALLTGCFAADTPSFYTCSAASPRCPDAMACVPISGLDSGILTDWKYERTPAVCLPIPKLDKGAADAGGPWKHVN